MEFLNVVVGAETGLLKGVDTEKKTFTNFNSVHSASKNQEVCMICWKDKTQSNVLVGLRDGTIQYLDTKSGDIQTILNCKESEDGDKVVIRGLCTYNSCLVTCLSNGRLTIWSESEGDIKTWQKTMETHVGSDIYKMRQNPSKPNICATGGKENDLKIIDLDSPEQPLFKAKNVPHDWLNLRVPVWVTDMQFIPESDRVVTSTGHSQVRVYDPKIQRRPIKEIKYDEYPITCMALYNKRQVIVANTHGNIALIDLDKGHMVQCYKGVSGSIRSMECHPTLPYTASCGLDRFLRVHNIETKALISKVYLKSRLNCLIMSDKWTTTDKIQHKTGDHQEKKKSNDISNSDSENSDSEQLWDSLEVVGQKRGSKSSSLLQSNKKHKNK